MSLSNEIIVIISMICATIAVAIYKLIEVQIMKIQYKKCIKRITFLEELVKNGEIEVNFIDVDYEPNKLEQMKGNVGLKIEGKLYNDKNAYFKREFGKILVMGKKENFVIGLVGRNIGR